MNNKQNKYWLLIVIAACFEVVWVMGLKHADTALFWSATIAAIIISFLLLIYTTKQLPASTAYAVFVGLGTTGTVIMEMTVFGVPFSITKVAFIGLLLLGIVGLKLVTGDKSDNESSSPSKRGERA